MLFEDTVLKHSRCNVVIPWVENCVFCTLVILFSLLSTMYEQIHARQASIIPKGLYLVQQREEKIVILFIENFSLSWCPLSFNAIL